MSGSLPQPGGRTLSARNSAEIAPPPDRGVVLSQYDLHAQGSLQSPAHDPRARAEASLSLEGRALAPEEATTQAEGFRRSRQAARSQRK